jgi:uncharacterized protein YbjT (DUF2867 family)
MNRDAPAGTAAGRDAAVSVVLVTGGTGRLGRAAVPVLREHGHEVRILSRRPSGEPSTMLGDLSRGTGLGAALAGVDVVVHAATTNGRNDVVQTRNLLAAMRPDQHLVAVSIVGIDRIPLPYYRAKLEAERAIPAAGIPWTIQRATQFHELVAQIFSMQRRLPVLVAPDFAVQPIDVRDLAERLASLVAGPPAGRAPDMGGPEVLEFRALAQLWRAARGGRQRIAPLRLPGRIFAGYRSGAHTVPDQAVGRIGFEEWLRTH